MRVNDCIFHVILDAWYLIIPIINRKTIFLDQEMDGWLDFASCKKKVYKPFFIKWMIVLVFDDNLLDKLICLFDTFVHLDEIKVSCVFFIHYRLCKFKE